MAKISEIKSKIIEILATQSANILPDVCVKYGLDIGDTDESFKSKRAYIQKRLANKDNEFIISMARKVSEDYDVEILDNLPIGIDSKDSNILVFISHLTADTEYARILTEILVKIGLPYNSIFCSSIPGQGIPLGQGFPEKIKTSIISAKVVFFIFSQDFYKSIYCTNEMGAAWVLSKEIIPVLIPPIKPNDMKGFIDNSRYQAATINSESDLNEFYGQISRVFNLPILDFNQWDLIKKEGLTKLNALLETSIGQSFVAASVEKETLLTSLLKTNKLSDKEILMLAYILSSENRQFGVRWMQAGTVSEIEAWENKNSIPMVISTEYNKLIDNLVERSILIPTEYTDHNNPRKYTMPIELFDELKGLSKENKEKLRSVFKYFKQKI